MSVVRALSMSATVLTPLESLTVIQDSLARFQTSGQEVNATYHGCALPTELRWLLFAAAIRLLLAVTRIPNCSVENKPYLY